MHVEYISCIYLIIIYAYIFNTHIYRLKRLDKRNLIEITVDATTLGAYRECLEKDRKVEIHHLKKYF